MINVNLDFVLGVLGRFTGRIAYLHKEAKQNSDRDTEVYLRGRLHMLHVLSNLFELDDEDAINRTLDELLAIQIIIMPKGE